MHSEVIMYAKTRSFSLVRKGTHQILKSGLVFSTKYIALSGLHHQIFYSVGLRPPLTNAIPSGLNYKKGWTAWRIELNTIWV